MQPIQLLHPLDTFVITQRFGDDFTCVDAATGTKCVTHAAGTPCLDGYVSLYASAGLKGHNGVDFKAMDGQEVYAAHDAVVRELVDEQVRGRGIGIVSEERFMFSNGVYLAKTRYWHLKSFAVESGQKVRAGELLGYADNTGLSAGTHLHFELKPVERRPGGFVNVLQDNGYAGAIDPLPYFPA